MPMRCFVIESAFHPVGQGLFASGRIVVSSMPVKSFNWVFDCGTASEDSLLEKALAKLAEGTRAEKVKRPRIGLVAISHFDQDHISGMLRDPATNVITTTYDAGGRVSAREITSLASGFDGTADKIETTYNSRGLTSGVKQKNSGGTVLDEMALDYDGWGHLSSSTQDPDSAIAGSGRADYAMTWTYALNPSAGTKALYLSSWTQPDGTGPGMSFTTNFQSGIGQNTRRVGWIEDANNTPLTSYSHLGSATVVAYDCSEPSQVPVNSLFTVDSSDYSTFMDRFNRAIKDQWSYDPGGGALPVIDIGVEYDLQGNVTKVTDQYLQDSGGNRAFDTITTYDDLRRPMQRDEGKIATGTITGGDRKRQELTPRNLAGRIISDRIDLGWGDGNTTFDNGPPNAIAAGEMDDNRTYNSMNRLTARSYFDSSHTSAGSRWPISLTYDANGNLTDDGETYEYKYNPWGQLVEIANQSHALVAKYTYNGFGQRISEQTDTNNSGNAGTADGTVDGNDPTFFIAVDPQGRRIATYRGTDTYPKETFVHHIDGHGPAFQGGLVLRDRDASLSDPTKWAKNAASSTRAERYYYTADFRGNVIALVDNAGTLVEQYRYAPSGLPYGIPVGCTDATTGAVTAADSTHVNALISGSLYETQSDFNMDGVVDSGDLAVVTANSGQSRGRGELSLVATHNRSVGVFGELFGSAFAMLRNQSQFCSHLGLSIKLSGDSTDHDVFSILSPPSEIGNMIEKSAANGLNATSTSLHNRLFTIPLEPEPVPPFVCELCPCQFLSEGCTIAYHIRGRVHRPDHPWTAECVFDRAWLTALETRVCQGRSRLINQKCPDECGTVLDGPQTTTTLYSRVMQENLGNSLACAFEVRYTVVTYKTEQKCHCVTRIRVAGL